MVNILVLDIETAPNLAYVWGMFKETIQPKQVVEDSTIITWAAKWLEESDCMFGSAERDDEKDILESLAAVLDEADMVVGHNVTKFDMAKIRGRCMVHGIPLPSPYKEIDTYRVARKEFGFDKNSLEYLSRILGVDEKSSHKEFPGFELWAECLKGNPKAWKEMLKYNIQDVYTTEQVYLKMRPYITNHPNVGVYDQNDAPTCPKCGSTDLQKRGKQPTNTQEYQRYYCKSCGGWSRGRFTILDKDKRHNILANAVN
jgi:DNA polymerase elongation subunit (family B)